MLQCVRHVVREKFFGIGDQSSCGPQLSPANLDLSDQEINQTERGGGGLLNLAVTHM